jgi:hypothetical protein
VGLAFAGTDDMRDSPASMKAAERVVARPVRRRGEVGVAGALVRILLAVEGADALGGDQWLQYRTPDFERIGAMARPLVIDGRNLGSAGYTADSNTSSRQAA